MSTDNIEEALDAIDHEAEEKARPLAALLIKEIDRYISERADKLSEHEDAGDMIYEAEEAAINALVYVMCLWTTREAREQELAQVERRIIALLMKRLGAH